MSRKHYQMIADVIKQCTAGMDGSRHIDVDDLVFRLCREFKKDNKKFKAGKFYVATGILPAGYVAGPQ